MTGLDRLNALPRDAAVAELLHCCGARAWAERMADARPFASAQALLETADAVWRALAPADWLEAFRAHPRIGERARERTVAAAGAEPRDAAWSELEQARVRTADAAVLAELASVNRDYEQRFGHIFLICATGLDAHEILAAARRRLHHDAETELRVAAEEQRRITRLRLERLP